ncbi:MAG: ATP synthase F1 subunit delta [Rickettsiales bacterium]|nr:ATP synthase F1 subunit delta [Rickettsiales bacterium]
MDEKVQYSKIHNRYALALITLAKETNETNNLLKEVDYIISAYENDTKFNQIFTSPLLSSKKQIQIVESLFTIKKEKKMKISKTMYSFISLIGKNARLNIFRGVLENFKDMISLDNQEVEVIVTSAIDLENNTQKELIDILEKKMRKKINLTNIVDKSIIGGLILQIGSNLIDASIKNKITKINTMIKGAI